MAMGSGSRWPGLSPRVRGNLLLSALRRRYCGSIPACAGEPDAGVAVPSAATVYPRVCGGTGGTGNGGGGIGGLSPRVRGNLP